MTISINALECLIEVIIDLELHLISGTRLDSHWLIFFPTTTITEKLRKQIYDIPSAREKIDEKAVKI